MSARWANGGVVVSLGLMVDDPRLVPGQTLFVEMKLIQ